LNAVNLQVWGQRVIGGNKRRFRLGNPEEWPLDVWSDCVNKQGGKPTKQRDVLDRST